MKKIIFSLLILFVATASWAETALIVHQKSGGTVMYSFSEKPVVTYSEGYLIISVEGAQVSYPLSDMKKFTFDDVEEDQITLITAPADVAPQPTYIYSVDGKLMRTLKPSEDGTTSASVEGLPNGAYIIKNGKTTYKVLKR